jgi:hypothetical protein
VASAGGSYTMYSNPAAQEAAVENVIHDSDIIPLYGKNPFSDPSAVEGEEGIYQLHITRSGKHGYANEIRGEYNTIGLLALRFYRTDVSEPRPLDASVMPPRVQLGRINDEKNYVDVPACPGTTRAGMPIIATE